jgi:hypothetical protein
MKGFHKLLTLHEWISPRSRGPFTGFFNEEEYTSHRKIPDSVTDYLKTQYEAYLLDKKSQK